jgi:hypothetical protein
LQTTDYSSVPFVFSPPPPADCLLSQDSSTVHSLTAELLTHDDDYANNAAATSLPISLRVFLVVTIRGRLCSWGRLASAQPAAAAALLPASIFDAKSPVNGGFDPPRSRRGAFPRIVSFLAAGPLAKRFRRRRRCRRQATTTNSK